jgi:hypothetical protein
MPTQTGSKSSGAFASRAWKAASSPTMGRYGGHCGAGFDRCGVRRSAVISLPLDAYILSGHEKSLLVQARMTLFARCMADHGIEVARPTPAPAPRDSIHDERYGIIDERRAATAGYHRSPPQTIASYAGPGPEIPTYDRVIEACLDAAGRHLRGDAPVSASELLPSRLSLESFERSQRDERVRAVFAAWSARMASAGFAYQTPREANNDPAFSRTPLPTPYEIRVAVADVRAKQAVHLVEVWSAVEAQLQRGMIERHRSALDVARAVLDAQLARASAVLATDTPP